MKLHPGIRIILPTTAMAMGLSSCALKDGRLDFTWWQDAAAPVLEDDVIIEAGGGGYYRSTPAPAQIPQASIPREEPDQPAAPQAAGEQAVAQHQPTTQPPPARPVTRPAAAPAEPGFYVVQPGDTLTAIARRHGTTVNALVTANNMPSANAPLLVNQKLQLPGTTARPATPAPQKGQATPQKTAEPKPAAPVSTGGATYKVQAGDTLYRISRQHGVSPAALMQANGLTPETANTIRVGAILRIPASN
jgi:LysM repeat protein